MSRIGKMPIAIPDGVTVSLDGSNVAIKGPKGELSRTLHSEMSVAVDDGQIVVTRPSDEKRHRALHGLTRSLLNNMVGGVHAGFSKTLEIHGVGYRPNRPTRAFDCLSDIHIRWTTLPQMV